jgi:ribosome biogenesis GTPase / thiamine phosphate phosphatase
LKTVRVNRVPSLTNFKFNFWSEQDMQDYSFDLSRIGATHEVYRLHQPYAARSLALGRVSAVHREQYRLYTAEGEMKAEAIGALLYRAVDRSEWPVVGDWVAAQRVGPGEAMIHAVLPRRTTFSRRAAGDREREQVIAANIDLALIVCGLDRDFNPRRIERYLVLARESGAAAAIVLNKADLCQDTEARVREVRQSGGGATVVSICAQSADGIEPILGLIGGDRTVVLLGSSGVGKSTLVNQLLGEERQRVQEVSDSDSRGRHTTTHRELVLLPRGGAVIDTPGMRELQLWAGQDSLDSAFDDIAELALECRFRDCTHRVEVGCAVQAAILGGEIEAGRWQSYLKLRAELAWHERKSDVSAALAQKQRWKKIHKEMRSHKTHW